MNGQVNIGRSASGRWKRCSMIHPFRKRQEIQEQFDRALAAIDGKINAWYQRLADNNGVSMQEARKMLDAGELKEFRWNVEEYTKYAEENEISGAWAKQLENASARVHISRLKP